MKRLTAVMIALVVTQLSCVSIGDTNSASPWSPSSPPPTLGPSHLLIAKSPTWNERWRRTIGPSYFSVPLLAISGDALILPVWSERETLITSVSTHDGHTIWAKKVADPDFPGRQIRVVNSLFADSDRVYAALPFGVQSFRVEDGELQWITTRLPEHTSYRIFPKIEDGTIRVYGITSKTVLYDIGFDDGQIKSTQDYPERLVLKIESVECVEDALDLRCTDNETKTSWKVTTRGSVRSWPLYIDSRIVLFASGPHLSSLTGVEPASGAIVWQTPEDVVSNFTTINGTAYSLRIDAALVARDVFSGQEVDRLQFGGGPLDTESGGEYWVVGADDKLFVYFGDSQELVALGPN